MKAGTLFRAAALCLITGAFFVVAPDAQAADEDNPFCDEYQEMISGIGLRTVHKFGYQGACYTALPTVKHTDSRQGYCHSEHTACQS